MKKYFSIWGTWTILFVFLVIIIPGGNSYAERQAAASTGEAEAYISYQSLGPPEYVGANRCKDCHWREHDSWKHTLHSKFMMEANEFTVMGDFGRNNKLTVKVTGKAPRMARKESTTTMYKKDGKYYVNTIGPDWEFHDYKIKYVLGINREQSYVTEFPNGELHVLPVEWEIEETKWEDNRGLEQHYPGNGKYWSDPGRSWQFACAGCHVTGLQINYNKASDSFKTTWADLGISCEACHGPGSNHIQVAKTLFDKEQDTIINPAKLPWKLRSMVCGQCHNWGASRAKVFPAKEGFPEKYAFAYGFKVGQPLYLFYDEELDDEKKHHQQYNEWEESAHEKAGVACTTCHGVHQEGAHKSPNKSQTKYIADSLCTNCHSSTMRKAAHRIHTFGSCIACHMPKSKGHEHSHTFEFVSPEESIRAGGVDKKPNSCSGCHHHKDTPLEGLVEFLDAVKKQDMPVPFSVHGR